VLYGIECFLRRGMIASPAGCRPLPAFAKCGSAKADNSAQGTILSISSRNSSRRLFRPYFSNADWLAKLYCFIRTSPDSYQINQSGCEFRTCAESP
jgi:hypothetical protein